MSERGPWFAAWRRGNSFRLPSGSLESHNLPQPQNTEFASDIEQLWTGSKSHTAFAEELSRRQFARPGRRKNNNNRLVSQVSTPELKLPTVQRPLPTIPSTLSHSSQERTTDDERMKEISSNNSERPASETSQSTSNPDTTGAADTPPPPPITEDVPLEDGIYGLNMFLARWAFDVARNPDFEDKFRALILKRLRGLRRPSYVMPLTLCSMDMGCNFPEICSLRSLPSNGTVICPELVADISYSGGLEVTIETFLDLREGSVWGQLDRALTSLQGNGNNEKSSEETLDASDDIADPPEDVSDPGMNGDEAECEDQPSRERQTTGFSVRKYAVSKAKQFADRMAESISKIPLRLRIKVEKLEGRLLIWISPPPAKRLWISFLEEPTFEITAKPILANRVMKYSAALGRVSSWLQRKIKESFFLNLVFPYCADMSFPGLLGFEDDDGLKHPSTTLMQDLMQVSECDSDYSDIETRSQGPSTSHTVSGPQPGMQETKMESDGNHEKELQPFKLLPEDDRLEAVRRSRYNPQRLKDFRCGWDGQKLAEDHIPFRESRGRRVIKRCLSLSDGDLSIGDDDQQIDVDGTMSDRVEFFDPEVSTCPTRSDPVHNPDPGTEAATRLTTKTDEGPSEQRNKSPTALSSNEVGEVGSDWVDIGAFEQPRGRRLGSRFGEFVRTVQSVAAEEIGARRRKSDHTSTGTNNRIRVVKQLAGEQRQRVRDAFENSTAQWKKNSGLTRMWTQFRNPENKAQVE